MTADNDGSFQPSRASCTARMGLQWDSAIGQTSCSGDSLATPLVSTAPGARPSATPEPYEAGDIPRAMKSGPMVGGGGATIGGCIGEPGIGMGSDRPPRFSGSMGFTGPRLGSITIGPW